MNKSLKSILQFVIFLGLGLFLAYYSFSDLTAEQIQTLKQAFINANYLWIALAFLISGLCHLSRAYRWKMLLQPMHHNPKLFNSFSAVMVGYLYNMAFIRLGEVGRCTILTKYEKIPFTTSFGTVITERLIDTITWLLLLALTIIFQFSKLSGFLNNSVLIPLQNKLSMTLQNKLSVLLENTMLTVVVVIVMILALAILYSFRKKFMELSFINKINKVLKGFYTGLLSIKKLENPKLFLLHTLLIWFGYVLVAYVSFFCMPQLAGKSFGAAIAIVGFATFAVIATQGGIGAYPLLVMQIMFLYDVDKVSGLAFGWIIWSAQAFQTILLGFLSLVLLPVFNKEIIRDSLTNENKFASQP